MKIKKTEIIAGTGMYIHRKGSDAYFIKCTLLPGEKESDFEEITKEAYDEMKKAEEEKYGLPLTESMPMEDLTPAEETSPASETKQSSEKLDKFPGF